MERYFEKFWLDEMMVEISKNDAFERGSYAVEKTAPMRFEHHIRGELKVVHYPNVTDLEGAVRDAVVRYPDTRVELHTAVSRKDDVNTWRTWYVNAGELEMSIVFEDGIERDHWSEVRYDADGNLVNTRVHVYDEHGPLRIDTFGPDGARISRQWVD